MKKYRYLQSNLMLDLDENLANKLNETAFILMTAPSVPESLLECQNLGIQTIDMIEYLRFCEFIARNEQQIQVPDVNVKYMLQEVV